MSAAYLSEDDVRALVSVEEVIDSLEGVLVAEEAADASNISKSMATWDPASSAHTLGGVDLRAGLTAFKSWVNTPRGASAVLSLFDSQTGTLLAVMEATHLGALRTAAIAGLATRWLAPPDADQLTVIGTGRQALRQVQAIAAVRPLKTVQVWSPTEANREQFAELVHVETQIETMAAPTLADAVSQAQILTLVTRATEPFLHAAHLDGLGPLHINAMGAILPANAELDPTLLAGAEVVAIDNLENGRRASRELREFFGPDLAGVRRLGQIISQDYRRPTDTKLTVFKAMGMGLSDLAAALVIARKTGLERTAT